ncbi:bifunctional anthranilate synthase component I family protein/class IV aminotransferase [Conexibacter sp. JD483]|uniref:bifunctional anthranilate synthase component I family protein/class IV aminotransferase n=1 Tax=unclassified Conexibacter TaxID=2627773 RepID=UPI00271E397E|nr:MULTISPECIES: bifunctional anthranilate synthase component I family protein/class IV aminotransferase [unclassified Conexibacter]MDO8187428.1 bifunctional anthranilate synthase component I family protein/class IV aminotransferase [Conexibacter sp. CPCC 205706]MDO8201023.1 bifunctional anthranilate synthase component I family protein/class IV aminotransferase [Conexibacter sp. CPCC 205762]MDR9370298.1 bifunctional anthranilate synthase component I family protein/class IV aminotransferase [Cone
MDAVRLLRVPLAGDWSVAAAAGALAHEPLPFALSGRWAGGGAIVGASPLRIAGPDEDPFALLDALPPLAPDAAAPADAAPAPHNAAPPADAVGSAPAPHDASPPADAAGSAPAPHDASPPADAVGGGWFGWLGFQLGGRVERLPPPPPRPVPLPPFQLAYYDHLLHRDPAGRWWFEALASPAREQALAARLDHLRALLAGAGDANRGAADAHRGAADTNRGAPDTKRGAAAAPQFHVAGDGAAAHLAAVADCRERIAAGELFQANICLRFEAGWPGDATAAGAGDALIDLYGRAQERLDPAYGALFPTPDGGVASLSPELFLRRRGRAVETAPIKGTIARDGDAERPSAAAARARLLASPKDHAEHVMIVDLMRNDLGRVCDYGSVVAAPVPEAEAHPGLWHLVSRVRGTLRADVGDGALLRATFPPGSVTGAPKVHALQVIDALEATAREVYTGAIGYASPLAGLELNVAIRTFEAAAGRLWLGAGGGIVADSDPAAELEECHVKARPLIAAIGGTLAPSPTRAVTDLPPPALRHPRRRPDPARGIFETLLVRDGAALALSEHLARLAASARTLYGLTLPDGLADEIAAAASGLDGPHRLRIALAPADATTTVATAPTAPRTRPVPLVPFTLPGGLGAHKWLDRDLLDELTAEARHQTGDADATPLLVDGAGNVLEASWAAVIAVTGETLLTAPADGRILPSVSRARLLAAARAAGRQVVEAPLPLARLAQADAIVLTSALGEARALLAAPAAGSAAVPRG